MAERLMRWYVGRGSGVQEKPSFNYRDLSDLYEKLSCTITPGIMCLLDNEIYQRGRVSRVADMELLLIAHLI